MKRSLLVLCTLFFSFLANAQDYKKILFNEFYTKPASGEHEFFELYNSSTDPTPIDLDCYSLVVFFKLGNRDTDPVYFYVLDFPKVSINPLSYVVGAAGSDFNIQKCPNQTGASHIDWTNLASNGGSLKKYSYDPVTKAYSGGADLSVTEMQDFLRGSGNSVNELKYAFFLFYKSEYVNGFLGHYDNSSVPSLVNGIPTPFEFNINCGINPAEKQTIAWQELKHAEYVVPKEGSSNGFIRKYDGKCGEWEKSSPPNQDNCTISSGEHTPNLTNGSATNILTNNTLSISTQRTVCNTRIDFNITGINNGYNNNFSEASLFPIVVQLYEDKGPNTVADGTFNSYDVLLNSKTVYTFSEGFHSFPGLDQNKNYFIVIRTSLGCIDKIVSPEKADISTSQQVYCGNQIDFSIGGASYNAGVDGQLDFTAQIYVDTDPSDGAFNSSVDEPIPGMSFKINSFRDTVSQILPAGYENKNYFVVYTSPAGCLIQRAFKASPSNTSLEVAWINQCGDPAGGDVLMFDVVNLVNGVEPREFPLSVELYYDNISGPGAKIGELDNLDELKETFQVKTVAEEAITYRPAYGQPVLLKFLSKRGCAIKIIAAERACGVLPVTFSNFHAQRNRQAVALKWETANEQNNRGFNVQRNTRGVWETVSFVNSTAGGGNSAEPLSYSFIDPNSERGVSQYRIQQVDFDGKASYSVIRSVKGLEQAGTRTVVYPNPSGDGKVNVVFEDQGAKAVTVSDISGRIVCQYRNVLNNVQIEGLESGMYSILITDISTSISVTEKVIIKKR